MSTEKISNENKSEPSCLGAVSGSAIERASELNELIEEEIIIEKNIKLFNKLKCENYIQRFEKPKGISYNFFMWTMLVMAIVGVVAACLSL